MFKKVNTATKYVHKIKQCSKNTSFDEKSKEWEKFDKMSKNENFKNFENVENEKDAIYEFIYGKILYIRERRTKWLKIK